MTFLKGVVVALMVTLTGCGITSDVELVKDGILEINKSLTIGEAFDNWKNCQDRTWEAKETDNGIHFVEFTCRSKGVDSFAQQIKGNAPECSSSSCEHLNFKAAVDRYQWTINRDDTLKLTHMQRELVWKNGAVLTMPMGLEETVSKVYGNEILFKPIEPITPSEASTASELWRHIYQSADKSGVVAQISPSATKVPESSTSIATIEGVYQDGSPEGGGAELTVSKLEGNTATLAMSTWGKDGVCVGEVEGQATIDGETAVMTIDALDDGESCIITTIFASGVASVKAENCSSQVGLGCSLNWNLSKK